jgi:hypothetical protein
MKETMRLIVNPLLIVCACLVQGAAASPQQQHYADISSQGSIRKAAATATSSSRPMNLTAAMQQKREAFQQHFPLEEMEAEKLAKKERMKDRREKAARHFASIKPNPQQLERVDPEDWEDIERQQQEMHANQKRKLSSWFSSSAATSPYSTSVLADPSEDYDKWAQGYRMLGGFIDCDHGSDEDEHSGDNNNDNNDENDGACSRWMIWAAVRFLSNDIVVAAAALLIIAVIIYSNLDLDSRLSCPSLYLYSTSTPTTRVRDTANTTGTMPWANWIATAPIPSGNCSECTDRNFISISNRFPSTCGPLTTTNMWWLWLAWPT